MGIENLLGNASRVPRVGCRGGLDRRQRSRRLSRREGGDEQQQLFEVKPETSDEEFNVACKNARKVDEGLDSLSEDDLKEVLDFVSPFFCTTFTSTTTSTYDFNTDGCLLVTRRSSQETGIRTTKGRA